MPLSHVRRGDLQLCTHRSSELDRPGIVLAVAYTTIPRQDRHTLAAGDLQSTATGELVCAVAFRPYLHKLVLAMYLAAD